MAQISEEEKLRRHQIIESVTSSSEMAGLTPDSGSLELMRRFEEGELEIAEFAAALEEHAQNLLVAQGPGSVAIEPTGPAEQK